MGPRYVVKHQNISRLITLVKDSAYNASVTNGIFKRNDKLAYARAADLMSTKSAADFEWCVKLMGTLDFNVGIATKQKKQPSNVFEYDQNAVFFTMYNNIPEIKIGSKTHI